MERVDFRKGRVLVDTPIFDHIAKSFTVKIWEKSFLIHVNEACGSSDKFPTKMASRWQEQPESDESEPDEIESDSEDGGSLELEEIIGNKSFEINEEVLNEDLNEDWDEVPFLDRNKDNIMQVNTGEDFENDCHGKIKNDGLSVDSVSDKSVDALGLLTNAEVGQGVAKLSSDSVMLGGPERLSPIANVGLLLGQAVVNQVAQLVWESKKEIRIKLVKLIEYRLEFQMYIQQKSRTTC